MDWNTGVDLVNHMGYDSGRNKLLSLKLAIPIYNSMFLTFPFFLPH